MPTDRWRLGPRHLANRLDTLAVLVDGTRGLEGGPRVALSGQQLRRLAGRLRAMDDDAWSAVRAVAGIATSDASGGEED
jgi:hypothetical protein